MSKILIDEATVKLALEALERTLEMLEQADCSTGYCCCGSLMDGHGIGDGHGPVDGGDYYQSKAIQAARHAITALREALAEQPAQQTAAIKTLEFLGYTYHGGEQWKPPLGNKPKWIDEKAQQEPVAWTPINQPYPPGGELDILMGDGSILCEVLPQADGDLWWGGASTGERFIDPKYASVTHWRIHAEHTSPPAQRKPWVGLTDEEAEDIWNHYCDEMGEASINDAPDIARAIESALRSKNT